MNILLEAITQWAKMTPDRVALVGGDETDSLVELTYSALLCKVEQVAAELMAQKIDVLALRMENGLNWAVVDLAAMMANVVVVPIPTFFSPAQVEHILAQSGADALLGDWQSKPYSLEIAQDVSLTMAALPLRRLRRPTRASYLEGTGKITFTSGSTGHPKGVCLSNEHLCSVARSLANSVRGFAHTHLVLLPLSTLLENITGIYVPLILGGTSYIFPGQRTGLLGSSQFNPHLFADILAGIKPDSIVLTPALLLTLISLVKLQPWLAESLKFVAVGGAKVSASLIKAAHDLHIPAFEGYGLSECGSVVCLNTPAHFQSGSCGKPLPHIQVRIAEDGEILVKGATALGYLNEPFHQAWLATGDLADMDEQGYVTLLGRKKNLIVTAYGRNVSPEWIESEALAFLPHVQFIITGDSQQALCAVMEVVEHAEEKISALNDTLPDYAQIRTVLMLDNPKAMADWYTNNGKLKRDEIEHCVTQLLAATPSDCRLKNQKVQRFDQPFQPSRMASLTTS